MNALSKLKVCNIEGLDRSDPFYIRRLINRRSEILLACFLTQIYSHFTIMMLHRSLAMMGNNSYAEAEKSANLFGSIFKLDVKPEDMMHHSDEEINNSLADYDKMCHYLDSLERLGIDQEDVIAFCKHVEYNSEMGLAWYQAQCNLHYKYYAEAVLSYLLDLCTYDEMAEQFFEYSLFTQKKSPAKVRRFIKDLKRVLDLFYEISAKRMRRKISGMLEYRR